MINVYFSTLSVSKDVQNDIILQLAEIDNVSLRSYEKENEFVPGEEKSPSVIVITPLSYSGSYITKALQAIADNPGKFILLCVPNEYNELRFIKSYQTDERIRLNLIKTAMAYEYDHMYESIYAVKCFFKRVSS